MHKNNFSMTSVWPNLRRTFGYTYQQKYLQSEKIKYQRKVEAGCHKKPEILILQEISTMFINTDMKVNPWLNIKAAL